jgi:hypothetical protein
MARERIYRACGINQDGGFMAKVYLRTDMYEEACRNVEFVADRLAHVLGDPYDWKWVILGLHAALQCFMVAALRDSAGINILRPRIRAKLLSALQEDSPSPEGHLDYFLVLYKGTQGNAMHKYVHSKQLAPTQAQDAAIRMLNSLRNNFVHFVPKHCSIEVSGLPEAVMECIAVIHFLAFECGNILWTCGRGARVKGALSAIHAGALSLKASYTA